MSDQRADKLGELWDVYTRQRQLTGRTHRRGEPLAQGDYHMVANALVFNQDGALLVQQRSFKKMALPGGWVLATGGSVLQGETSLEGIQREVVEELGAQAT
ncbi:NUDIX hydrolase [Leuconostoc falkenbergense]